jgi:hypothetical protein
MKRNVHPVKMEINLTQLFLLGLPMTHDEQSCCTISKCVSFVNPFFIGTATVCQGFNYYFASTSTPRDGSADKDNKDFDSSVIYNLLR